MEVNGKFKNAFCGVPSIYGACLLPTGLSFYLAFW